MINRIQGPDGEQSQWPPHAFQRGGGGGPSQSVAATPVPAASPPVTTTNAEVMQAQQDLRRQALKKRGFANTIKAGDTGGWFGKNATPAPTNPRGGFVPGSQLPPTMFSSAKTLGS